MVETCIKYSSHSNSIPDPSVRGSLTLRTNFLGIIYLSAFKIQKGCPPIEEAFNNWNYKLDDLHFNKELSQSFLEI